MVTRLAQTRLAGWAAAVIVGDFVAVVVLGASRDWSAGATLAAALVAGALALVGVAVAGWLLVVRFTTMGTAARVMGVIVVVLQVVYAIFVILIGGIAVGMSQWNVPF